MIRVVLAVALAAAIFGLVMPSVEHADRERSAALATEELERLRDAAERLAAENDPVAPGRDPAATTVALEPPEPTFAEPGRLRIADDSLRWESSVGRNVTIDVAVPVRIDDPAILTDRARVRLALVRTDGAAVVRLRVGRERVYIRTRGQTPRVRPTAVIGGGLSL
ncbi:uncharacterized protein Nmlp_1903 [Natronomonas moolapensis 8.8.11]|uniref:DUF7311 domain-containing protein n=1 Tax=Natronomonas moolapensis (strain DSM 18674 / CECT 7526 / JCM 14361 / 8.8.11) TaxID=268739 RepID=M1XPY0_NATM8|nr:hypothetical protein [Natronomonas moolapensis]CCQ36091.1 uncharacterized protein Nmlp_1903 [Natronomonas moolapensis 8.8.11]